MQEADEGPHDLDADTLLKEAIEERERGNLEESLRLLINCERIAKDGGQLRNIQNHIGLAYFHMEAYKDAYVVWDGVRAESWKNDDLNNEAVALRNLSRKELYSNRSLFVAVICAERALEIAKKAGRKDVVWFIHGLFDVTNASEDISKKDKKAKLLELYKQEKRALVSVWRSTPKLEREVWLTGLLKDFLVAYNCISKPILKVGILITKVLKLKRREEQLKKLLSKYKNN